MGGDVRSGHLEEKPIDPNITVENDLLLYKNRWYIPNDANIKKRILHDNHDSKLAGHFGINKTTIGLRWLKKFRTM